MSLDVLSTACRQRHRPCGTRRVSTSTAYPVFECLTKQPLECEGFVALRKSKRVLTKTRQAGQGSAAHGGCCASLGHKFGFGGTLDQTLLKVLGCKERGHKSQGPLVHATGKGWVKEHKGQYYDALHVKNGIVKICLVESQGGIAPPTKYQENHLQLRQRGRQPERRRPHRLRHSLRQRPGLRPAPLATALARRRLWRRAKHQQRCSQHACRALIHDRSQCPTPCARAFSRPVGSLTPSPGLGLEQVFRKTKRKTEGPQHFAFPEISRENRGCLVLRSGNSLFSLSLRAGLGQNLRQN